MFRPSKKYPPRDIVSIGWFQVVSLLLSRDDILVNQRGKDGVTALGLACLQEPALCEPTFWKSIEGLCLKQTLPVFLLFGQ
jgi:hypothetical protein